MKMGNRPQPAGIARLVVPAVLLALPAVLPIAWTQTPKGLTARELFYAPPPSAAKSQPAKPQTSKPAPPPKTAAAKKSAPSRPSPAPARDQEPAPVTLASDTSAPALSGDAHLVNASNVSSGVPLGLRYSILKYAGDDDFLEVDPDLVFRSGDKIRLRIQVNDTGYLYVVTQGSSGNWRVLFPSAEFDSGSNRVVRGRSYDIPGRTRFVFDEQPGTEKLFLVLSRQPENDLDKLIYHLDTGSAPPPAAPAAEPKKAAPIKTMMAMNSVSIDDGLVNRMRGQMLARDLVFEKVADDKPAAKTGHEPERAVYVVNPDRSNDSRLVVDVSLKHR